MFGLNDLEGQLRRLQVFLDYCDNTKQELETLNLVAQRNIPVTFTSPAADVINDTVEPAVEPRIMKAIPVHAQENRGHQDPANNKLDPQRRNRALLLRPLPRQFATNKRKPNKKWRTII
jgi:hypothetical protein